MSPYDSWLDEPYHEQAELYDRAVRGCADCEDCGDEGEAELREDGAVLCISCFETRQYLDM
jgi:hypothetical protein